MTASYRHRVVLRRVSFRIRQGEVVGILGPSGAGKTTLVELIPRLYEVHEGEILLDGVSVRDFDLRSLRSKIGIVSQETLVLDDTLFRNMAYGTWSAGKKEVIAAAKRVGLHDLILRLERGYETRLGERGAVFSGGELQRVAIARMLVKDPELLILDEATNALDPDSEAEILRSLESLMEGRTVLVVAHRSSLLKKAHRLLRLEEGRIDEVPVDAFERVRTG